MCEKQGEQITFDAKLISFTHVTKSNWKTPLISIRTPHVAKWPGIGERKKKWMFLEMHKKGLYSAVFECQTALSGVTALSCIPGGVPGKRERSSWSKAGIFSVCSTQEKAMLEKVNC